MSRFVVLMYHMIREPADRYACPPARFRAHLEALARWGYRPVSLDQAAAHLSESAPLPDKAFAVTLDDGFEDNYTHAFPVLQELGIPATVFLATGYVGKTNTWMAPPHHPMLTWKQIAEMHRHGIGFGGHTVQHPRLDELDDATAAKEIRACRSTIEDRLGTECRHFAYPYGRFNDRTVELVRRSGYRTACSTRSGFNHRRRDPLVLHRIEVQGGDSLWELKQKLTFGTNDAGLTLPLRYYANRIRDKLGIPR